MQEQQWLTNLSTTTATTTTTESTSTSAPLPPPPPPILLSSTETSMEFCPPPPSPAEAGDSTTCSEQVAYYKLFGRVAAGSCVKVREVDKILPGLGMEVGELKGPVPFWIALSMQTQAFEELSCWSTYHTTFSFQDSWDHKMIFQLWQSADTYCVSLKWPYIAIKTFIASNVC